MKALSFTQPWLECILHHGKRVENRTAWTACNYRGPILLHAAKGVGSRADFDETVDSIINILRPRPRSPEEDESTLELGTAFAELRHGGRGFSPSEAWWAPRETLHRGGIVGRAEIVDVVWPDRFEDWAAALPSVEARAEREAQRRWWFGGFALVLDKVEALPFVPWVGALGLFEVDIAELRDRACALGLPLKNFNRWPETRR